MYRHLRSTFFRYFALWLVLVIVVGRVVGSWCMEDYRLAKHGIAVQGVALAKKPHRQIQYSFEAGGREYKRTGIPGHGVPDIYQISIGDAVTVYYLPGDPEISCLGNPEGLYRAEILPVLLATFIFPTIIVVVFFVRLRKQ